MGAIFVGLTRDNRARVSTERRKREYGHTLPGPLGFIGAGKVGTALAALLHHRGAYVAAVAGRTPQAGLNMALGAGLSVSVAKDRAGVLAGASIVFLTVPDDAIGPLCDEIAGKEGWRHGQGVVHCSGALPSTVLGAAKAQGARVASFHPLQAFANLQAALKNMPGSTFALEGDPALVAELARLVEALGGTPLHMRAEDKTLYHAAAVMSSNYLVTLAALASELLVRDGIAPDATTAVRHLVPLLRGTLDNLQALGLPGALTGPLARGDAGTIARHLKALERGAPDTADLYRHLARLTLPMAEEKGSLDEAEVGRLREALEMQDDF
jgi:predicted short-subunit dehydrogenase-like oxidoreductase (DUF2520 family)